ncbi:hypothetical protein Hanom_Chr11g01012031 [Helianthus anomalus]
MHGSIPNTTQPTCSIKIFDLFFLSYYYRGIFLGVTTVFPGQTKSNHKIKVKDDEFFNKI